MGPSGGEIYEQLHVFASIFVSVCVCVCVCDLETAAHDAKQCGVCDAIIFKEKYHLLLLLK